MTTYFDNQATIKQLRDSGVPNTPALNSKAIVLQAWLDSYNRKKSIVEEVPAIDEIEVEASTAALEAVSRFGEEYPCLDSYEQSRVELLENCVNVTYYPNGVVSGVNKETLYCELPQTPNNSDELDGRYCVIADKPYYVAANYFDEIDSNYWFNWELAFLAAKKRLVANKPQSLSDFEGIDCETIQVTDWLTVVPLTYDISNYQFCELSPHKLTLTEIMARPDIEVTPEQQRELDKLEELYGDIPAFGKVFETGYTFRDFDGIEGQVMLLTVFWEACPLTCKNYSFVANFL